MNKWIVILAACLGTLVPGQAFCQYQSALYDVDSSSDLGLNLFLNADGSILMYGGRAILPDYRQEVGSITVDSTGTQMLHKSFIGDPNVAWYPFQSGDYSRLKRLPDSTFIGPLTVCWVNAAGKLWCNQGIMHLDKRGDLLFSKTYSDTSYQYDFAYDVTAVPGNGYMLAGQRFDSSIASKDSATLIHTDSAGNMLWQRTYKLLPQWGSGFFSIQYLDSGKLLVGGYANGFGPDQNYTYRPWFLLMDTAGNILHQKFYPTGYREGGNIFKDKNGGYFSWGSTDEVLVPTGSLSGEDDYRDYPGYVMHLDDSFNVQWKYELYDSYTAPTYNSLPSMVRQLADSGYIILAQQLDTLHQASYPRIIKLDKFGYPVWQQNFIYDTVYYDVILMDAIEKVNGDCLLLGTAYGYNSPQWRNNDYWLLGIDSNGCASPGCTPLVTAIHTPTAAQSQVQVYPNPTTGAFHINMLSTGTLALYNIQGQLIYSTPLQEGVNDLRMPGGAAAGIYVTRIQSADGTNLVLRLVYQP